MTEKPSNPCRNCGKPQRAKGLCATCYQRKRRRGLGVKAIKKVSPQGSEMVRAVVPVGTAKKIAHTASLRGCGVSEVVRDILVRAFGL